LLFEFISTEENLRNLRLFFSLALFVLALSMDAINLGIILKATESFQTNFTKIKHINNLTNNNNRYLSFSFYPFDSNFNPALNPEIKPKVKPNVKPKKLTRSAKTSTSLLDIHFYLWRNYLTKVDGPKCPHIPTCSHFAYLSIKKYGIRGSYYATSRLLGEFGDLSSYGFYELHIINGIGRIYDPVKSYQTLDTITIKQSNY